MAVFFDMVEVVNRTSQPLEIRYDGQRHELAPNYTEDGELIEGVRNLIPRIVVPYALNQCVLMGSEDFLNPSRFESLIGVIDGKDTKRRSWHNTEFLPQSEVRKEVTRVPQAALMEEDGSIKEIKTRTFRRDDSVARLGEDVPTPFDLRQS
jgi:hypothetical protein